MRIVSHPEAEQELEAAALWYEKQEPGLGHAGLGPCEVKSSGAGRVAVCDCGQRAFSHFRPEGALHLWSRPGQDLVKQDQVSSPAAADVSDYYGYDALGSVRYLIQQSAGCPSLDQRREGFLCLCSGSAQAYRTGMALELA